MPNHFFQFIIDIVNAVLPPHCLLCLAPVPEIRNICPACARELPILPNHCAKCARSLPKMQCTAPLHEIPAFAGMTQVAAKHHPQPSSSCEVAKQSRHGDPCRMDPRFRGDDKDNASRRGDNNTTLCGRCLSKPPPFDTTLALMPYQAPAPYLITQLKFQHQLTFALALGELLCTKIKRHYRDQSLPDIILPIPLHPARLRERGFNQALEIAKPIRRALNIAIDASGTTRNKNTARQSGLSAAARQRNVASAFDITGNYTGKHIAVLDDVITTGATISAFCAQLQKQRPKRIDVWCCARR